MARFIVLQGLQQDLYGQNTHLFDRLIDPCNGRGQKIQVGVIVERNDRQVVRNIQSGLFDRFERTEQDCVAQGEDSRRGFRPCKRQFGFDIPVLD